MNTNILFGLVSCFSRYFFAPIRVHSWLKTFRFSGAGATKSVSARKIRRTNHMKRSQRPLLPLIAATLLIAGAFFVFAQTHEKPVRSVTDPGVVTTRQTITP